MSNMVQLSTALEDARRNSGPLCDVLNAKADIQVTPEKLDEAANILQEELGVDARPVVELAKSLREGPTEGGMLRVLKTACANGQLAPMAQLIHSEIQALSERVGSTQSRLAAEFEAPALVVSGGVSMGSYQAGFAEGLLRQLRSMDSARSSLKTTYPYLFARLEPRAHLRTNVGASAGSINAFIAGIESCTPNREAALSKSLFFKSWIDVGFTSAVTRSLDPNVCPGTDHTLYDAAAVEGDHILNNCVIHAVADTLGDEINARASQLNACSFDLAMTATRLSPRTIPLATGASADLPRMTEKFLMHVKFDTAGAHYQAFDPPSPDARRFFPKVKDDYKQIAQIIQASAAFPLAFSPKDLSEAYAPLPGVPVSKNPSTDTSNKYIDGGLFNNNPLDMARLFTRTRAAKLGQADLGKYLFLDQDFTEAMRPLPRRNYTGNSFYVNYQDFLPRVFEVATTQQLMAQLEYEPELLRHLLVPIRSRASPSEFVFAMSGFLHRDLRVIDFYDGLLDAERMAEKFPLKRLAQMHTLTLAPTTPSSPGFQCVRALRVVGVSRPTTVKVNLPPECLTYLTLGPQGHPFQGRWQVFLLEGHQGGNGEPR